MKWTASNPATEPVSYVEMKEHLRLDNDDEKSYITGLIIAARTYAEGEMQISLVNRDITLTLDKGDTATSWIALPRGPVSSIKSVTDANGTIAASEIRRIGQVDSLYLPCSYVLPISVVYVAGFGTSTDVPADIRTAIKMHVAYLWMQREAFSLKPHYPVAMGLDSIYSRYRVGGWVG